MVMGDNNHERRRPPWLVLYLLGMGILAGIIVLPMVDQEMMRAPFTDAILAVRRGDVDGLRGCFAPGATLAFQQHALPAERFISALAPMITAGELRGTARFGDYSNIHRQPGEVAEADFTLWIYIDGGSDLPYKQIPLQKKGHTRLIRTGWFRWKIQRINSDDAEFGNIAGSALGEK